MRRTKQKETNENHYQTPSNNNNNAEGERARPESCHCERLWRGELPRALGMQRLNLARPELDAETPARLDMAIVCRSFQASFELHPFHHGMSLCH